MRQITTRCLIRVIFSKVLMLCLAHATSQGTSYDLDKIQSGLSKSAKAYFSTLEGHVNRHPGQEVFSARLSLVEQSPYPALLSSCKSVILRRNLLQLCESEDELAAVICRELVRIELGLCHKYAPNKQYDAKTTMEKAQRLLAIKGTTDTQLLKSNPWSSSEELATNLHVFKILKGSKYKPEAIIVYLEKLALAESPREQGSWFNQIVTPFGEQALALRKELSITRYRRSAYSSSFRVGSSTASIGGLTYLEKELLILRDLGRMTDIKKQLNLLFDDMPSMLDIQVQGDALLYKGAILLKSSDLSSGQSLASARLNLLRAITELQLKLRMTA